MPFAGLHGGFNIQWPSKLKWAIFVCNMFSALLFCHYYATLQIYKEEMVVYPSNRLKYIVSLKWLLKGTLYY